MSPALTFGSQVVYGLETGAAYSVGARFHGLANNSMTDEERRTLPRDSPDYGLRVDGSKLQLIVGLFPSSFYPFRNVS